MPRKSSVDEYPKHVKREALPQDVRRAVLHEAAFKCANPRCWGMLTLNLHHLYYVSHGGTNEPDNLVALCGQCHDLHHGGHIPGDSIRAWKMLLVSINENFDRRSLDILLLLADQAIHVSGDGLLQCAALVAAKLVRATSYTSPTTMQSTYLLMLTPKGTAFVSAWKAGDERAAIMAMREEIAAEAVPESDH